VGRPDDAPIERVDASRIGDLAAHARAARRRRPALGWGNRRSVGSGAASRRPIRAEPMGGVAAIPASRCVGDCEGTGETRWIGTVKGLYRVNLSADQPTHVQLVSLAGEPIADLHIKSLHVDRQGACGSEPTAMGCSWSISPRNCGSGKSPGASRCRTAEWRHQQDSGRRARRRLGEYRRGIARIDTRSFAVRRLMRGDGIAISSYLSGACADEPCSELMFGGLNGITLIRQDRSPGPSSRRRW